MTRDKPRSYGYPMTYCTTWVCLCRSSANGSSHPSLLASSSGICVSSVCKNCAFSPSQLFPNRTCFVLCWHIHTHTYIHTRTHTRANTQKTHNQTETREHIQTYLHRYKHTHAHTHTHTNLHTHQHIHTHKHIHMYKHANTYIRILKWNQSSRAWLIQV